ncbi:MAG: hypothetical protein SCALA702_33250 [Melioribacteraceae bacterium]|nr:MAG: hypothetical protein SCALA702_33250 [Melioribacteraceae bacterium]
MPLKRPDELPKIPKTRKKKMEAAIEAIPEKKPDKLEYVCKAFFQYDEVSKTQNYIFAIETVTEFVSFAYEVTVEIMHKKREIYFVLMGLKALTNMAPQVQPARTDIAFEDLIGDYTVYVVKQDGSINAGKYHIDIYNKEIKLLETFLPEKENNRHFCDFKVAEEEFSFGK